MTSVTHASLLDGLRDRRNDRAWRLFYDRYVPMLMALAKRLGLADTDAQDVVADTLAEFITAYREGIYDPARGRLRHWLKGIVRNKLLQLRHRRHVAAVHADAVARDAAARAGDSGTADEVDAAFEREWQLERLNQALATLRIESDVDDFQAFDLYALKGWPVQQVAAFLGVTANVVYLAKSRGMKRLREILSDLERDPCDA